MSSPAQLTTAVVSGTVKQVSVDHSLFKQIVRTYSVLFQQTSSGGVGGNGRGANDYLE